MMALNKFELQNKWYKDIEPPPENNLQRVGGSDWVKALKAGADFSFKLAKVFEKCHPESLETKILDFGCGWGRVLLPFSRLVNANLYGTRE